MSWRDRAAQIVANLPNREPIAPTEAPGDPVLSVLSVTPPGFFQKTPTLGAIVADLADAEGWNEQHKAESLEDAWSDPAGWLARHTGIVLERFSSGAAPLMPTAPRGSALRDPGANARDYDPVLLGHLEAAHECNGCAHLDASMELGRDDRRKWLPVCLKGHRPMRAGYRAEVLTVAPPGCDDFSRPELKGPGVYH